MTMWFIINSHPRKKVVDLSAGLYSRLKKSNKETLQFILKHSSGLLPNGETVMTLYKSINGFDFIKVMEPTNSTNALSTGNDDDDAHNTRLLPDIKCSKCNNGATRFDAFTKNGNILQLSIWIKINDHPDEEIVLESLQDYSDILRSNVAALEYAQSELLYLMNPGETLRMLYKSADGVNFDPVIEDTSRNQEDDSAIRIVPDTTCESCEVQDQDIADNVDSFGSNGSHFDVKNRFKNLRRDDTPNENQGAHQREALGSIGNSRTSQQSQFSSCETIKGKKSSAIWSHCKRVVEENIPYLVCSYCQQKFADNKNTTNMTKHLKTRHAHFFSQTNEGRVEIKTSKIETQETTKRKLDSLGSSIERAKKIQPLAIVSKKTVKSTPTIKSAFENLKNFRDGGVKEDEITNLILYMFCVDKMPLCTVEKPGFNALMKKGFPLYKVPSRSTITDRLERKYTLLKSRLVEKLQSIPNYCVTADNWTDRSNQSYMGLTVHFLNHETLVYESACLGCIPLYERHTSDYLQQAMETIFAEFNIVINRISLMLTDSDPAIKKASINIVGASRHLACMAHICSKILPDAIKLSSYLVDMIAKIKNIVCLIRHSIVATDKLLQSQVDDTSNKKVTSKSDALHLTQDVATRWTSTIEMLDRYLSLELYIPVALRELKNRVSSLSQEELEVLSDILPIMKPFSKVIKDLSGDRYPTCSITIPIINCLELTIKNVQTITQVGEEFKNNVLKAMKERLGHIEKVLSLSTATILDPRFKKLHFNQIQAAAEAISCINKELKKQIPSESRSTEPPKIADVNDVWNAHDSLLNKHQDRVSTIRESDLSEELDHYLKLPLLPRKEECLKYWRSEEAQFPNLAKIALAKLSNLATTVPSERQFSKAGLIDTPNRSQLTGMHLNMLVFLSSRNVEEWGIL